MGRWDWEEQRYRLLFERHWRRVSAYVERRCPDKAAAEDVVAEVFLVAWRRIAETPQDNDLPWLFGVARRVLANSRRAAIRRQRLVERLRTSGDARVVFATNEYADGEKHDDGPAERIRAALGRLRPVDAEILRLSAWEELTPTQIAVVMRCTPNAAAVRLHRARKRLSDALESQTPEMKESERFGHNRMMAHGRDADEPTP